MRFFTQRRFLTTVFTAFSLLLGNVALSQATAGGLSFDGINDKVRVVRNTISGNDLGDASFNISDFITIESWLYAEPGSGFPTQSVVAKSQRQPASSQTGYIFPRTDDNWSNIAFHLNFNGLGWKVLTAPYPGKGTWNHVAATYDGNYMRIFINGVLANQMAVTGTITVNTNPLTIGYQNGYTNEFFRGRLDELRIWNRALTQCEIAANRNCEITDQNKLVAYYKFNQGLLGGAENLLEKKLTDSGPYANHGTLVDFGLISTLSNWTAGAIANGTTCVPFVQPTVTIGSNALSIQQGGRLELTANGGVSYSWTGPNGFTSTQQNPVIENVTGANAGIYTVNVTTATGCTVPESITIGVSVPARALNFDGLNDYISVPHNNLFNTSGGLTIETWIYPTNDNTPTQSVISKSSILNPGYRFPRTDDGWKSFSFHIYIEGVGWNIISASYPAINEWHHVAATYDGSIMKIYLDGVLKATKVIAGNIIANTDALTIGTQAGYSGEHFQGSLDEVRVWNRALTECEIQNNRNCQINPVGQLGLSAYYRFNKGLVGVNNVGLNTADDESGNNNNGTLYNMALNGATSNWSTGKVGDGTCAVFTPIIATATANGSVFEVGKNIQLQATGGTSYAWTGPNGFTSNQQSPVIPNAQINNSGLYTVTVSLGGCNTTASTHFLVAYKGGSLTFDGADDEVVIPNNPSLNISKNITLESWIYPTDGTRATQDVLCKSTLSVNNGYKFPRTDDGWKTISFFLHLNGQWKVLTANNFPGLNKWTHCAATYDGYYMRIYLNGVLAASTEASGDITMNSNNLVIGQQPGFVEYFKGKIDEAKVWKRALNQCEIINNMNCELQPAQKDLVAYYKFNQGFENTPNPTEKTLIDLSGNNNNGTLNNFALTGTNSNWSEFKVNGTCSTYAEPPVTAEANASVFGVGSTILLFANGGTAYTWSGPNNFLSNLPGTSIANAQPVNSGTYTVAVPFINCTIFRSVRLTVTPLPAIQANGPTTICPSSILKLSIPTVGASYQWFRNGVAIPGADSAIHSASESGSYHVAVTTMTGQVQVSAPIDVFVVDNVAPVPDLAVLPVLNLTAPVTVTTNPTATDNCAGRVEAITNSPITFTQSGTYTIEWIYNDGNGNEVKQTQQVNVVLPADVTPPVITVPANIVKSNDLNTCGAIVTFAATATDNRSTPSITYSHLPGSVFAVGTTTVTVTASDAAGNIATATFTVTVNDTQAPAITAPANITSASGTGIILGTATATDNCSQPVLITNSTAPSVFPLGVTEITWTATDAAGNVSTAKQKVTILDTQMPTITAPPTVTTVTNNNQAFATDVNLGMATATDNSGSANVTNNAPSQYPIGITTVTWTATDASGNQATAIQLVIVEDKQAPALTGPADKIVNTNAGANFATNVDLGTALATDNSGKPVNITNNAPVQYQLGVNTITWTAIDAYGNSSTGVQKVTVVDAEAPAITEVNNIIVTAPQGSNTATVPSLGTPIVSDNVGVVLLSNNANGNVYPIGTTSVIWTAKDAAGNTTTGTQLVTVKDGTAPVLVGLPTNANASCTTIPSAGNVTATDNYDANVTVQFTQTSTKGTNPALANFYNYTITRTWSATDAAGNTTSASRTVTVTDTDAPVFGQLSNIVTNNTAGTCGAIVNFTATATDACGSLVTYTYSQASGTIFAVGVTTVNVTATDVSGNTVSQSFTVTVNDNQAPVFTSIPANITIAAATNTCGAVVNYAAAVATDNCSEVTLLYSKPSGTEFSIGTTTVTVTARDAAGNVTNGSFTVTVNDTQAPSITAPANITVAQGSPINLGTPIASDNCGTPVVSNNAPTSYPVGVTTIIWTATDAAGNRNTATQTVTVTTIPTTCSSSITVVPENTIYTGGIANNIYLGYGPQKVTLKTNVAGGTSYTYSWTAVSGNGSLSSTTSSQPVFAPTTAGNYTFRVTVRTQSGCVSTSSVTVCVKDIRVKDQDDDKCDHKSHSSKDCKHGKHNHGKCDHKSHNKDKCKDKYDDGDDDNDECDHKSHDSKNCKHKGHRHNNCDHKSHNSSSCKNKYNDRDDDDHDDDDEEENYKVYLCHAPNGNTGNVQTLKISVNAVAAHLSNHPGDRLGSCADQGCAVTPPVPACTSTITVVPENNTYTGGVPTNLYIGYGPQRVTLQVSANGSSNYSYSWRALTGGGSLSNTTSAQPVFTATTEGYYTFEVTVTGQSGCTSTSQVGICVKDIRVEEDCNDWGWLSWLYAYYTGTSSTSKVYITRRNGNSNNYSVMEVKSTDVAAHLQRYPNDILGKGLTGCVSNALANTGALSNTATVTEETVAVKSTAKTAQAEITDDLGVIVMGNPSRSMFTVKIQSKHNQPVQIRVFDMYGRAVESKANQNANSTVQFGHNLENGTYYAEFTQGSRRKVVQLIKVK